MKITKTGSKKEYYPKLNTKDNISYMTFEGWLIQNHGALANHDIEEFWE